MCFFEFWVQICEKEIWSAHLNISCQATLESNYQLASMESGDLSWLTHSPSSVLQSKALWLSQFHLEEVGMVLTVVDMSSEYIYLG